MLFPTGPSYSFSEWMNGWILACFRLVDWHMRSVLPRLNILTPFKHYINSKLLSSLAQLSHLTPRCLSSYWIILNKLCWNRLVPWIVRLMVGIDIYNVCCWFGLVRKFWWFVFHSQKYSEIYIMFYLCLQQRILSSFMADSDGLFEKNRHYRMLGHRSSVISDFCLEGTNGHIKSRFFARLKWTISSHLFFIHIFKGIFLML